ncbi:MAG: hypothetical protein M3082_08470 [Candidatus Dormibacteraeota bacterium]|nr:hypothetical protein [Candidatus Dormibacteraeota bacterium]
MRAVALRVLAVLFALSLLTFPGIGLPSLAFAFSVDQSCTNPREPMGACRLLEGGYGLFLVLIVVVFAGIVGAFAYLTVRRPYFFP